MAQDAARGNENEQGAGLSLTFHPESGVARELTLEGRTIRFRAFEGLPTVAFPVDAAHQTLNFYAPETYFEGGVIRRFTRDTAPIFLPNTIGGYMPGLPGQPGVDRKGRPNAIFEALARGCVVAAPGARGRTLKTEDGTFTGKAPACIVDLEAAVRCVRAWGTDAPGDKNRIVSNGTSAGGALSSLLGATGGHPDYAAQLAALGAAEAGDDIWAASCYCPITNLENADAAYEWQFGGLNDWHGMRFERVDGEMRMFPVSATMNDERIRLSEALKPLFPPYVAGLGLTTSDGMPLTLGADGRGSLLELVRKLLAASAQRALDTGTDLSACSWLSISGGTVTDVDFEGHVRQLRRMKQAPAFDDIALGTPENDLFGTQAAERMHFTAFSAAHSETGAPLADASVVRQLNPMNYIGDDLAKTARHWRIRHGAADPHTAFAISALLAAKLRNEGSEVDLAYPWGVPHDGDYDLDELFAWIDGLCGTPVV